LSAQAFDSRLIGDASLMRRPMERVAKPLREMGADVRTHGGTPPVDIGGGRRLRGIEYRMPVASAQVKSAVLLAALYADAATTVVAPALSRDHSERMLASCGVRLDIDGLRTTLHPPRALASQRLDVPGDFSSAAFFIVAGLLGAAGYGLVIRNVGMNPTRTGLLDILRTMGASIEVCKPRESGAEPVADLLVRASRLRGIQVPAQLVPLAIDELPVLFIAAACAAGETVVTGGGRASREGERPNLGDERGPRFPGRGAPRVARRHAYRGPRHRSGFQRRRSRQLRRPPDRHVLCGRQFAGRQVHFDSRCGERGHVVPGLRRPGAIGGS